MTPTNPPSVSADLAPSQEGTSMRTGTAIGLAVLLLVIIAAAVVQLLQAT
ncbi:MAG TPA: hypothetical protein VJ978_04720 [Nitriliruptoraceae bacterium]|nr:hypothetical protein [Nitriliruptoraceae bacterium]